MTSDAQITGYLWGQYWRLCCLCAVAAVNSVPAPSKCARAYLLWLACGQVRCASGVRGGSPFCHGKSRNVWAPMEQSNSLATGSVATANFDVAVRDRPAPVDAHPCATVSCPRSPAVRWLCCGLTGWRLFLRQPRSRLDETMRRLGETFGRRRMECLAPLQSEISRIAQLARGLPYEAPGSALVREPAVCVGLWRRATSTCRPALPALGW